MIPPSDNSGPSSGTNQKGKGKAEDEESAPSFADRLQASGRLVVNAVTRDRNLPAIASAQKESGGSSSYGTTARGEPLETTLRHDVPHSSQTETFKKPSFTPGSEAVFEEFVQGSGLTAPGVWGADHGSASVRNQEAMDGLNVLRLLSQSDMSEDEEATHTQDPGVTPDAVASLRHALFGGSNGRQDEAAWDRLLNFMPDFLSENTVSPESVSYTGISDIGSARQTWLRQWGEVLSSYTDEVWGDLGPLAAEAKREVATLATKEDSTGDKKDITALARLRQVLGHIRGHG
ncbi:hypothetical protein S7711_08212 [Stachybotrys chartarum IBT 7711]|uniref:Uncharacterized protein n=1 Tax=Stachybotrys chartarum (strain CBS 109288 / IBT 7711) TaxID=1280523 RepID=A0A084AI42_STACB|nr:hypothetical protein S7711_08212 [Stachybotrys chartarum IBT 7711]